MENVSKYGWVLTFIKNNWRSILMAILLLTGVVQTKRVNDIKQDATNAQDKLVLKEGELAKAIIEIGRLRKITGSGSSDQYHPPEASTDIIVKENRAMRERLNAVDAQLGELQKDKTKNAVEIARLQKEREDLLKRLVEIEITSKPWGFVFKPGVGALYSGKLLPEFDVKFLYVNRYSLKVGITPQFVDFGVTRHVDDLIPFFHFQNVEIQIIYGRGFDNSIRWGIGVRSNL